MNRPAWMTTIVVALCLSASSLCAQSDNQSPALRVYVDPATGRLAPAPAQETPEASMPRAFKRAAAAPAPQVEAGTTPAGGVVMQLGSRFVGEATVSVGADGKLSGDCLLPRTSEAASP